MTRFAAFLRGVSPMNWDVTTRTWDILRRVCAAA